MKKCGKIFTLFIFTFAFIFIQYNIIVFADSEIPSSEFEDSKFYQYIIENFDTNGDGVLQQSEAEAVTVISINNVSYNYGTDGIASIKGIEYFSNLMRLDTSENYNLKSLEPIRNLTQLVDLDIDNNYAITDFSPIYGLIQLESLSANSTYIQDISFLSNMKHMACLILSECGEITDFAVISGLTELVTLQLYGEKNFNDITILKNLSNLVSLDLGGTGIVDFSMLSTLENISSLTLMNTGVTDLEFLKGMNNLEWLYMYGCTSVEDYTVLGELTNLKKLDVSNCNLSDIQMLASLINMEEFILMGNSIETLPDMTGWTNLTSIYLPINKITEEEALLKLPSHITSQDGWQEKIGLNNQRYDEEDTSDNTQQESGEYPTSNVGQDEKTRVITSVSDNNISVQGVLDDDIYLEAKRIENTGEYNDLILQIRKRLSNIIETSIYDIWLYRNEIKEGENVRVKVQPDGSIKVMIKIEQPEGVKYNVFRQEDNGSLKYLDCLVDNGILSFYSEHFSIFSVVISRLLDDEETAGNEIHNSDAEHDINIQDKEENTIFKPGNEETDFTKKENYTISEGSSKIKNERISEVNGTQETYKKDEELNNENTSGDDKKRNKIEGILGIIVIVTVGAGLFGYDMLKRIKGDYMRNFQIEESESDSGLKQ